MADFHGFPSDETGEWCSASRHGDVNEQGDCLPDAVGLTLWAPSAMAAGHTCYEYLQQVQAELDYQRALVLSSLQKVGVSLDIPDEGPGTTRQCEEDEALTSDFSDIPGTSNLEMPQRSPHKSRVLKKKKRCKRRKSAQEVPVTTPPAHRPRPRLSLGNPSTSQEEEGETAYPRKHVSSRHH